MNSSLSVGPNGTPQQPRGSEIQRALQTRTRLRKAFQNARSNQGTSTASDPGGGVSGSPESIIASAIRDLEASSKALREYLAASVRLITISVTGLTIFGAGGAAPGGSNITSNGKDEVVGAGSLDICRELDMLFQLTVSRPARALRQILERRNMNCSVRKQARDQLHAVVNQPLQTMFLIGDTLIQALLQAVDVDKIIGTDTHFKRIRQALLRLLMYVSDCHRYQFNNGRAFDAARLMSLVAPRDPEAHMRLALTGAQLTNVPINSTNVIRNNDIGSDRLEHFFHFCTFLANRSVPLQHNEASVVHKFVASCRLSLSSLLFQNVGNRQEENRNNNEDITIKPELFVPLFIDSVWSCLTPRRIGSYSDVNEANMRRDRLWKTFRMVVEWNNGDEEHKKKVLSQRECEHITGALIFASHRTVDLGGAAGTALGAVGGGTNAAGREKSSIVQQRTANNDTEKDLYHGDTRLVDEMICETILCWSIACKRGLHNMVSEIRQWRKRRRRSIQKQKQRQREQKQQRRQANNKKSKNEENLNADTLNLMHPDRQAPGLGALSLLGIYWTGRRLGRVVESQDLITKTLLSIQELIRTIDELHTVCGNELFVSRVKEKLNRDRNQDDNQHNTNVPIQPALPEDVAVQHFKPCDDVSDLNRVVKHDVALVSLVNDVVKTVKSSNEKVDFGSGEILTECLKEFGKRSYEEVAGQVSRKHLEAFSVQCTKDGNGACKWTGMTDRTGLAKIVILVIRQSRLCQLVSHLEKINGGTLLDRTLQKQKEKERLSVQRAKENANNNNIINKENQDMNDVAPVTRKRKLNDHRESDNDNGQRNDATAAINSAHEQERIADSELERRVIKRIRIQGGITVAGSTSPLPGGSHESAHQFNKDNKGGRKRVCILSPAPSSPHIRTGTRRPCEPSLAAPAPALSPVVAATTASAATVAAPAADPNGTAPALAEQNHQQMEEQYLNGAIKADEPSPTVGDVELQPQQGVTRMKKMAAKSIKAAGKTTVNLDDAEERKSLTDVLIRWLRDAMPSVSPRRKAKSRAVWQDSEAPPD